MLYKVLVSKYESGRGFPNKRQLTFPLSARYQLTLWDFQPPFGFANSEWGKPRQSLQPGEPQRQFTLVGLTLLCPKRTRYKGQDWLGNALPPQDPSGSPVPRARETRLCPKGTRFANRTGLTALAHQPPTTNHQQPL